MHFFTGIDAKGGWANVERDVSTGTARAFSPLNSILLKVMLPVTLKLAYESITWITLPVVADAFSIIKSILSLLGSYYFNVVTVAHRSVKSEELNVAL